MSLPTNQTLRKQSVYLLAPYGLTPIVWGGFFDGKELNPPSAADVMNRCHSIFAVLAIRDGADPQRVLAICQQYDLLRWHASDEHAYLEAGSAGNTPHASLAISISISWLVEAAWVLLWALGTLPAIDPTQLADNALLEAAYAELVLHME